MSMRDVLGPGTVLGYCTNVHAGTTLGAVKANLDRYAVDVKARVSPDEPLGIGLWLPASAARDLVGGGETRAFARWLDERGLFVFTINGFPYGAFHGTRVKENVYRPDWTTPERLAYVSCDPGTFARDAKALIAAGLELDWVQPLDLFPQTPHIELVACFSR